MITPQDSLYEVAQWLSDAGCVTQAKQLRWCARAATSPFWRGYRLTEATMRSRLEVAEAVLTFVSRPLFESVTGITEARTKLATGLAAARACIMAHIADSATNCPVHKTQTTVSNLTDRMLTNRVRELVLHPGASLDDAATREAIGAVLSRLEEHSAVYEGTAHTEEWFRKVPTVAKAMSVRSKQLGDTADGRLMSRASRMLKSFVRTHFEAHRA